MDINDITYYTDLIDVKITSIANSKISFLEEKLEDLEELLTEESNPILIEHAIIQLESIQTDVYEEYKAYAEDLIACTIEALNEALYY